MRVRDPLFGVFGLWLSSRRPSKTHRALNYRNPVEPLSLTKPVEPCLIIVEPGMNPDRAFKAAKVAVDPPALPKPDSAEGARDLGGISPRDEVAAAGFPPRVLGPDHKTRQAETLKALIPNPQPIKPSSLKFLVAVQGFS